MPLKCNLKLKLKIKNAIFKKSRLDILKTFFIKIKNMNLGTIYILKSFLTKLFLEGPLLFNCHTKLPSGILVCSN